MELSVVRFLNGLGHGTLDAFTLLLSSITFLAILWTCGAVVALRFDKRDGRKAAVTVVAALALHFLISEAVLKHLLLTIAHMRVRPYLADPAHITPVGTLFVDSSFPSSHMASTAGALTAFVRWYRRALPFAIGLVLAMAFARMHNGMHYPSDVLAGTLLGVGYGVVGAALVRRWWPAPAATVGTPVAAVVPANRSETAEKS